MNKKELYSLHCKHERSIPVFSRDWWLDVVCGKENWDVAIVENSGKIAASMPYYIRKKFGLTLLRMPALTQTLGPWISSGEKKYANQLAFEKDVMTALIEQLPTFDNFLQSWNYRYTNWLPFYWKGFEQTTSYTYVLEDLSDLDAVWAGFQEKVRTDIRKAKNRFQIVVREDLGIEDFLALHGKTFERQGISLPYPKSLVRQLDSACNERGCRKILIAEDAGGQRHAGIYIVWDENSAYYLMSGGHPELRNSGATSLLIWEAIRATSLITRSFDFEGSMIESIERFFRGFGAEQKSIFSISKTNSFLLRFRNLFRKLLYTPA